MWLTKKLKCSEILAEDAPSLFALASAVYLEYNIKNASTFERGFVNRLCEQHNEEYEVMFDGDECAWEKNFPRSGSKRTFPFHYCDDYCAITLTERLPYKRLKRIFMNKYLVYRVIAMTKFYAIEK